MSRKKININRLERLHNEICKKKAPYEKLNQEINSCGLRTINGINIGVNEVISGIAINPDEINGYVRDAILVCVQKKIVSYDKLIEKLSLNEEDLNFVEEYIERI